jgi:hypothetical protein
MIILVGFVLALGAGVGLAAAQEAMDDSIKGVEQLSSITGIPVFSMVSLMESDKEKRAKRIRKVVFIFATIGVIVLALFMINQFVMPLDIILAKVQRRLALMELPL